MNRLKDIVLSLLLLGIVVQGWVWLDRQSAESDTAQNDAVRLGDSLPFLRGTDRGQAPVSVRLNQEPPSILAAKRPRPAAGTVAKTAVLTDGIAEMTDSAKPGNNNKSPLTRQPPCRSVQAGIDPAVVSPA